MPPSSPLTCQPWVRPVTAVRARLRTVVSRPPTCTKPPSGIHTPTYLTISPRSELGNSGWVTSYLSVKSRANSRACPSAVQKSSAPTSSRRALWVSRPLASAMQISSTRSSSASSRSRRLDSSGSSHHGSWRISYTWSRTAIAWRSILPSTRSRISTATSANTLSKRWYISRLDIFSCKIHVSTSEAANASATAPTSRHTSLRLAVVFIGPSSRRSPRRAPP